MNLLLVLIVTVGGTLIASRLPNQEDMVNSFQEAQRFYAEGAYDQAIVQYEAVSRIRSKTLDTEGIQVTVGEEVFPVQEAADYQIGNSYAKVYTDYARQAEDEPDGVHRGRLASKADSAFAALETIYAEEVGHVAYGSKWFNFLCGRHELDPRDVFHDLVRTYFHGALKPPFNEEKRAEAGLPPDFYWPLAEEVGRG